MHLLNAIKITVNVAEALEALKKNSVTHETIVKEAWEGYRVAAKKALKAKLKEIDAGKDVDVNVRLQLPRDYRKVYTTLVRMLELHTEPTITLDQGQVRGFLFDEWDWKRDFLVANSVYSGTAATSILPEDE